MTDPPRDHEPYRDCRGREYVTPGECAKCGNVWLVRDRDGRVVCEWCDLTQRNRNDDR